MKIRFLLLILSLSSYALIGNSSFAGENRIWTDIRGKTIDGTFVKATASSVTLSLSSGREVTVPLNKLTQEDKDYVKEQLGEAKKDTTAPPAKPKTNKIKKNNEELPLELNNYTDPWPSGAKSDDITVTIISENDGEYIYETAHFKFISDAKLTLKVLKNLAKTFESAFDVNCALPFSFPCRKVLINPEVKKYEAKFYATESAYYQNGGMPDSAGIFIYPTIHVPFKSLGLKEHGKAYTLEGRGDPKTLIHELTHQMSLERVRYPHWFSEGIAEYISCSPYKSGLISFKANKSSIVAYVTEYGKKNTRGRAIGNDLTLDSLQGFMTMNYETFLEPERVQVSYGFSNLLVYYFCHIDGKGDAANIIKFIESYNTNPRDPKAAYEALLAGRTWEELEKDVSKGMKQLKLKLEFKKKKKNTASTTE